MRSPAPPPRADLVLVGGGHAHVQVLRRWMMRPVPGVRLTVVVDRPEAVYSGMVPGLVAGDYAAPELEIDVVPLARRARARVVLAAATRILPDERRIELEGRMPLAYDVASLDVGSSVRGLETPGAREHALATRPIRDFVDRVDAAVRAAVAAAPDRPVRIAVVGGGAAGIELAFTLEARVRALAGGAADVVVLCASSDVLPGSGPAAVRSVRREAARRGIALRCGLRVVAVEKAGVRVDDGSEELVPSDLTVWATGAAPQPLFDPVRPAGSAAASGLPLDAAGFVRVDSSLQVEGHPDLFAVGDCASLVEAPWVPKAGVYAVRQGPVLDANLRAHLRSKMEPGRPAAVRPYRPQRDFLALLNLGDRRALAIKWGVAASGRGAWWLKDAIDRRFMRRFQVLAPDGTPARDFPSPESMGMPLGSDDMACGGCAAKLGERELGAALAGLGPPPDDPSVVLGLERPDDVAAVRVSDGRLQLATIDGFRAFSDDPWLVGRVAAVNAASDVLAKGGRPRHALALVTVPDDEPDRGRETLAQVLGGVRAALDPLGVSLVGGHTTRGPELFVGLSVTGDAPVEGSRAAESILRLDGARPGDVLVLSKPVGTGVVLAADMQGRAAGGWVRAAHEAMLRANDRAAATALAVGATAATDVSGFGLASHALSLVGASGCSGTLRLDSLPILPGAMVLLRAGVRSTFHEQNARAREALDVARELARDPRLELVFDPQTSGGLLFAVPAERAQEAVERLRDGGDSGAEIGRVERAGDDGARLRVVA